MRWKFHLYLQPLPTPWASQVALVVKNPPANAGDVRGALDPWVGKIAWRGHGNPLQCSCLENPIERAWRATVHGVPKSQTQLKRISMHSLPPLLYHPRSAACQIRSVGHNKCNTFESS